MAITEKEFREILIVKIEKLKWDFEKLKTEYEEQLNKYQNALEAINEITSDAGQFSLLPNEKTSTRGKPQPLRAKIEDVLRRFDMPLTSRELMDFVNNSFSDKHYTFKQFSGQFSIIYRSPNSKISKYEIKDAPPNKASFYCLKEWFNEDTRGINKLQDKYKEKIYDRYGVK